MKEEDQWAEGRGQRAEGRGRWAVGGGRSRRVKGMIESLNGAELGLEEALILPAIDA